MTTEQQTAVMRPIIGIQNRTAQEVFDIMCDRFRLASQADQGEMNWKAEWEAASSENIRLRAALNQICDLGCCGGKGLLQKAIDIAVTAVTATHPQPSQKGEGDE